MSNTKSKTGPPLLLYIQLDTYEAPVVFPTEPDKNLRVTEDDSLKRHSKATKLVGIDIMALFKKGLVPTQFFFCNDLVFFGADALYQLSDHEKTILWDSKFFCIGKPGALPKLLQSVSYNDRNAVQQMHQYLND